MSLSRLNIDGENGKKQKILLIQRTESRPVNAATANSKGEEIRVCKNDSSHTETRVIPSIPDTSGDVVTGSSAFAARAVAKGRITAVGTGECMVYVLAHNGVWDVVKVNVQQ